MASKVGDLRIELSAETAAFRRDMEKARGDIRNASKSMSSDLSGFKSSIGATSAAVGSLTAVIGALATSAAVGMFVSTITEFERLNASLKTMTGSSAGAEVAMAWLQDFAAETPYQLSQVVSSFTKLKAMGMDPSREAMESYGNTASAMGKDLNMMVEAVADAATGEFERLKEFGIKAKSEGDKVSFTFQGVTTTVKKSSKDIEGYLIGIGQHQFAGAMADQMDTLNGKISNLKDSSQALMVALGDTGLRDVFKNLVGDTVEQLEELTTWFKENPDTVRAWGNTFMGVVDAVHAEVLRLGMLLDKIGGTMTFIASLPSAIPAALGVDSSQDRMQRMADLNIMYEQRYQEKDRQLQELANRSVSREMAINMPSSYSGTSTSSGSALGGGAVVSGGGGDMATDLKKQVAMVKEIYAELEKENQAAISVNQEMYEQLGIGAENVAKDEVQALMERAERWKVAGADISKINEWLYEQIDGLRATWSEKGEQEAVDYLNKFSRHSQSLIDEYISVQEAAVAELNKIGVRMDLLDKQDINLDVYLRDHASSQINAIIAKVQSMQAYGLGVESSVSGSGSASSSSTTTINISEKVSRSDVSNIVTEYSRQGDRS